MWAPGQGPKALIAELIAGEIGRALGLNVPELVLMEMSPLLARTERHEEILDSAARQRRVEPGDALFCRAPLPTIRWCSGGPTPDLASAIVWFDAFVTNVDRTDRNVNMLLWQQELWLIDHGAALYFHHDWATYHERALSPFALVRQHTLLPLASRLEAADARLRASGLRSVLRGNRRRRAGCLAGDRRFLRRPGGAARRLCRLS